MGDTLSLFRQERKEVRQCSHQDKHLRATTQVGTPSQMVPLQFIFNILPALLEGIYFSSFVGLQLSLNITKDELQVKVKHQFYLNPRSVCSSANGQVPVPGHLNAIMINNCTAHPCVFFSLL